MHMHVKHINCKFDKGINSADVMLIAQLVINVGSEHMQLCASRSQTCLQWISEYRLKRICISCTLARPSINRCPMLNEFR